MNLRIRRMGHEDVPAVMEIERVAFIARAFHQRVGCPQRLEDRIEQGTGGIVGTAVDGGLRLRVAEFCSRAHQYAVECMRALAAVLVDHHAHCEGAARLAWLK